jgi:CheY-like chemotaxis protein
VSSFVGNLAQQALRVIVAHDESAIRDSATQIARDMGYEVIGVADGQSARVLLASKPTPVVLVADVALPRVLGYELCDDVRRLGLATKVIFIASVYSRTAYKRRPTNLYGAYDYVEQHHIVDQLHDLIERAVADATASVHENMHPRPMGEVAQREASAIKRAGEERMSFTYTDPAEGDERARRLAELIVADIVLYCGDDVEAWLAAGAGDDLPDGLARDLAEGRRLFDLRVPAEIANRHDYLTEALRDFAARRSDAE